MHVAVDGPRPRVCDHQTPKPAWSLLDGVETDRAAPILNDDHRIGELEPVDELHHHPGVFLGQTSIPRPREREPETWVVDCHTTEPVAQRSDHVAVDERPGRVAMQHEQRRTRPLIDVVDRVPVDLQEPTLKREQRLVHPGWPDARRRLVHELVLSKYA